MPRDFDIEAVGKKFGIFLRSFIGGVILVGEQQTPDLAFGSRRQSDQPSGMRREFFCRHIRIGAVFSTKEFVTSAQRFL